jgi:hypothetical protein
MHTDLKKAFLGENQSLKGEPRERGESCCFHKPIHVHPWLITAAFGMNPAFQSFAFASPHQCSAQAHDQGFGRVGLGCFPD